MYRSPEYSAWHHMLQRCTDPNATGYKNYGGRGIKVCDRWLKSFIAFLADMGRRPSAEHTIERKRNNGPYSPANCVWLHQSKQGRNKRNNLVLRFRGKKGTTMEWEERTGIPATTIKSRLRQGWSVRRALTTPVRAHKPYEKKHVKRVVDGGATAEDQ
jgi:hypothetical protein